ncbi:DUF4913 domain-containing protein [Nocardia yamanashiensis]|uniref:DUF4913 domain-containing protein n=1 Tax=Nocardia yamanashiensis TaxID=209247 RepID=UPI000830270F|nr:DUF4913 domain-containing protein [Nocardia yamanashiensis]
MSDNGTRPDTTDEVPAPAAVVIPQMDLGELLDGAIRKAVTGQIAAQARDIATEVVAAMLTPDVLEGMRQSAIVEAELALNPIPTPDPEPDPEAEPAPAATTAAQEDAQPAQPPRYPTLRDFVERYVIQVYRRSVSTKGAHKESGVRWCPCWWDHGEVVGRFKTMHRAFEHLRLGEGTEPSLWWLVHFDPHMDRIMSPTGPFMYCSVADGHAIGPKAIPPLPVLPAPPGVLPDEEDQTPTSGYVTASGLVVPSSPARPRELIREWLE